MSQFHHTFEAIGTHWVVDGYDEVDPAEQSQLTNEIIHRIEEFDKTYSRFRNDSVVKKMSHTPGIYQLPSDSQKLFQLYETLYNLTDGKCTPLIGSVLEEAGYDAEYSLQPQQLHTPLSWEEAFDYKDNQVIIKQAVVLDFGAAGKGYLVDLVSDILRKHNIKSFCVDAGGDMFYQNSQAKPLRVGLEHPSNFQQVIGVASILNQSICGSAGNRRTWHQFHHIINPFTLSSPTDILAVWAVADSAIVADALTTCLFFVTPETLLSTFEFEYAIVNSDLSLKTSSHFPGEFFRKESSI